MTGPLFSLRRDIWPKRWWLLGVPLAAALVIVLVLFADDRWSLPVAETSARTLARSRALISQGLVDSQLQKYRILPLILADYPSVQDALESRAPATISKLNSRLRLIAERTDAAQIYVLGADGTTIAASNWQLPTSFVGHNYGFRPYFTGAMQTGAGEQFALGTVSKRPGLFLARRVANRLGAVVVKVEFNPIESSWSHQTGATIVRDGNGVVVMTSRPDWRLRATRPLSSATIATILGARRYGARAPALLAPDIVVGSNDRSLTLDRAHRRYVTATLPLSVDGWTITAMEPLEPAVRAASAEFRIAGLILALIVLVVAGLWVRAREARQMRAAARLELEHQVELRTAELRRANEQLVRQSRERERNEKRLRLAREELAQSNRLATLGQITAGVAHEINQPLAALRTYAENAQVLVELDRPADVSANVGRIVELSDRIGSITGELRLFARREVGKGPVALDTAMDGALLLIGDRLRQSDIHIVRQAGHNSETMIAADRIRIEQILINLLQNAIDAVAGIVEPRIVISTAIAGSVATITITDNGIGISEAKRRDLFKSFATQKPDGLGLGLVISRDLAREVSGELTNEPCDTGAAFHLRLPLA